MIDPTDMSAVDWMNQTTFFLPVAPMTVSQEEDWRAWAFHALQSPAIARFNPPQPDAFDDWREWAYRFNEIVFP